MKFDLSTLKPPFHRARQLLSLPRVLGPALIIVLFLLFVVPFLGETPSLDSMVNYRESLQFHTGGIAGLLRQRGGSSHPPLLYLLHSVAFLVSGKGPLAGNLVGILIFGTFVCGLFAAVRVATSDRTATLATAVVAFQPLVMTHSFFPASEMLILASWSWALFGVVKDRPVVLTIALSALTLSKQTALVFVGVLALVHLTGAFFEPLNKSKKSRGQVATARLHAVMRRAQVLIPPALLLVAWEMTLHSFKAQEWNNEIKAGGTSSPFLAALEGFLSIRPSNIYFRQNLENGLFDNFNWIFLAAGLLAFLWSVRLSGILAITSSRLRTWLLTWTPHRRLVMVIALCALLYTLLVMPFPTWTIPRYSLPLAVFLVLGVSLSFIDGKTRAVGLAFAVCALAVDLTASFASLDPLTADGGRTFVQMDENLYDTNPEWRGADRAAYNLQYARTTRRQNEWIRMAILTDADVMAGDCRFFKLAEKLAALQTYPDFFPQFSGPFAFRRRVDCFDVSDLQRASALPRILGGQRVLSMEPAVSSFLFLLGANVINAAPPHAPLTACVRSCAGVMALPRRADPRPPPSMVMAAPPTAVEPLLLQCQRLVEGDPLFLAVDEDAQKNYFLRAQRDNPSCGRVAFTHTAVLDHPIFRLETP